MELSELARVLLVSIGVVILFVFGYFAWISLSPRRRLGQGPEPGDELDERELALRIQEMQHRNRELSVLNQVIHSVNYQHTLQQILNDALQVVISGLEVKAGTIYLRSGDQMLLGASAGLSKELQHQMERLDTAQVQALLEQGTIDDAADVSASEAGAWPPFVSASGLRSWLALELATRDLRIGLMLLAAEESSRFTAHEVELVSSIAGQLSIAIENASLFQETLSTLRRLEAMNRASQAVNASLDLQKVQESIARSACELANADAAGVYEWDAKRRSLQLAIGCGLNPTFVEAIREIGRNAGLDEDAVGQTVLTRKPVEMPSIASAPGYVYGDACRQAGYESLLTIPMLQGDDVLGAIALWWRKPHRVPMDIVSLLTTLANQSVSGIENARLNTFNEQIVHFMDEGILIENAEGIITFANPRVCEMLGYDHPEDLVGQRILSWIHTSDRFVARQQHNAVLAGERRRYEAKFQAKHGSTIPVLASSTPLAGHSSQQSNVLTVLTDLSELKQLQERLLQTEKLSALGQLVAGVAHELNNPLTSIIGYAQLIRGSGVSAEVAEDLDRILRHGQRAAEIVHNLLAFARQERPRRQRVDVNDLIQRTIALRSYELRVQNIRVVTELDESLPETLADPMQLQQVFLNLILNAEQAMMESGVGSQMSIRTWHAGEMIHIAVVDDGPGISPELAGKIFDPFFTTKEEGKGTGLGLSICYGVIQEHGGRIWVEDDGAPRQGASFRVTLPIASSEVAPAIRSFELQAADPERTAPVAKGRVLLIDDEQDIVDMASRVLSECGYTIRVATSGQEAVELLNEAPYGYDLILCDIRMPGMSGFTFYGWLEEKHPALTRRVAFMTGDVAGEDTAEFLKRTGVPTLSKPFDVEGLITFVRDALDNHISSYPSRK